MEERVVFQDDPTYCDFGTTETYQWSSKESSTEDSDQSLLGKRSDKRHAAQYKKYGWQQAKYDFSLSAQRREWYKFGALLLTAGVFTGAISGVAIAMYMSYTVPYVTTALASYEIAASSQLVFGALFGAISGICLATAAFSFFKGYTTYNKAEERTVNDLGDDRTTGITLDNTL